MWGEVFSVERWYLSSPNLRGVYCIDFSFWLWRVFRSASGFFDPHEPVATHSPNGCVASALNESRIDATRNARRLWGLFEGNAKAEQNQVDGTIVAGKSHGGSVAQIADDVCDQLWRFENVEKGIELLVLDAPNSIDLSVAGGEELHVTKLAQPVGSVA